MTWCKQRVGCDKDVHSSHAPCASFFCSFHFLLLKTRSNMMCKGLSERMELLGSVSEFDSHAPVTLTCDSTDLHLRGVLLLCKSLDQTHKKKKVSNVSHRAKWRILTQKTKAYHRKCLRFNIIHLTLVYILAFSVKRLFYLSFPTSTHLQHFPEKLEWSLRQIITCRL